MLAWFKRNQVYKDLFHFCMVISETVTKSCYWHKFKINRETEMQINCRDDIQEQAPGKFVAERHEEGSGPSNWLVIFQPFQLLKKYLKCLSLSPSTKDNNKQRETQFKVTGSLDRLQKLCPHWQYQTAYIMAQHIIWNRVDNYWLWTFQS